MTTYQLDLEGGIKVATGHPIRDQLAAIMEAEPETQADEDLLALRWVQEQFSDPHYERHVASLPGVPCMGIAVLDERLLQSILKAVRQANIRERRRELTKLGYPWPPDEAERRQRRGKAGPPGGRCVK